MEHNLTNPQESEGFIFLPATTGKGVLVRRTQVVGARPNGPNEGAIVYTLAGPSLYTSLTTSELAQIFKAEPVQQQA